MDAQVHSLGLWKDGDLLLLVAKSCRGLVNPIITKTLS